ncbi:MAG: efflux RND transporter periplasmic adaptor subunit [Alistipes sp.]|nr:efflux RND transporter periplasmic adaptor subunit [Alistipes sp.]
MKRISINSATIALFMLITSCNEAPQPQQIATYDYMKVSTTDTEVESRFSASIRGRQDISIMPQVSGTISKVCINEGESVKSGETLFIIDQVPYRAALETAEANVKAAEAGVAIAKLNLDSKRELFSRNVISEYELRLSENQLLSAEATLAQAMAQRTNAANSLGYTVVKAPSNGVVGTIPYRVGALVGPTIPQPLTTVSDNSEMYVYFSMNESQLLKLTRQHGSMDAALKAMPQPELCLSDGSIYDHKGVIESISGVIDQQTGSITLRAVFPNPGKLLHSGSSGEVVLRYYEKDCIVIPCIATYEVQDKTYVYQPVEGKATSKIVKVSSYDGTNFIVREGLEAGDIIITEGVAMLREGTPIKLNESNNESSSNTTEE